MNGSHAPGATPLDPNDLAGLIPSAIANQGDLNAFEQANILDAQRWALRGRRKDPLTDEYVRELHRRMLNQVWKWAGRYRSSDKNIGVPWQQVPTAVRQLCHDARYWIEHTTFAWDELAVRFHHRLVAIHPFPNGNGRHARLLTDVLLARQQQPLFSWGAANLDRVGEVRGRYLAALRAADRRDFAPLLAFVRA